MTANTNNAQTAQTIFTFINNFKALGFREFVPSIIIFAEKFFIGTNNFEFAFIPFINSKKNAFGKISDFIKSILPHFRENNFINFTFCLFSNFDSKFDFTNFRKNPELQNRIILFAGFVNNLNKIIAKSGIRSNIKFSLIPILEDEAADADIFGQFIDFIQEKLKQAGVTDIEIRRSPAPTAASFRIENVPQEFIGGIDDFQNIAFNKKFADNDRFIFIPDGEMGTFPDFQEINIEQPISVLFNDTGQFFESSRQENEFGFSGDNFMFAFRKIFSKAS